MERKRSLGTAEFKIVSTPDEVRLVVHNIVVAEKYDELAYGKIFRYAEKILGGNRELRMIRLNSGFDSEK